MILFLPIATLQGRLFQIPCRSPDTINLSQPSQTAIDESPFCLRQISKKFKNERNKDSDI